MATLRECVVIAAIGGLLPTAAKLATTYTTAPDTPVPGVGLVYGLLLFAVIGAVLAYALSETNVRQALVLGIAAPGVITNIVAGANHPRPVSMGALLDAIPFATASAQTGPGIKSPAAAPVVKALSLRPVTRNGDAWSNANLPVSVTFILPDGTSSAPAAFVPIGQVQKIPVPNQATAVRFTAGQMSREVDLSALPTETLDIEVTVKGKNDFFWALGARREAIVGNLKVIPGAAK